MFASFSLLSPKIDEYFEILKIQTLALRITLVKWNIQK